MKIPAKPVPRSKVLETLASYADEDVDWHGGRVWALVYHASDEHRQFLADAHAEFASTNLLNPLAFKSLKRMENEVVSMTASLLNAPPDAVGTMTSGGTESILLAVKAARDRARRKKVWIRSPEMVAPASIHPAFHKAAEYFGVKLVRVPLRSDFRVDVDAMRDAVGRNTILIAASAPQYAHGVVDDIEAIGAFARQKKIPMHVDACFGGFILPWFERLGEDVPVFDFRVPGVTSMSADIHKFGYAAKGASVLVYRSMDYLRHQFHVDADSPLGIYASPTILGTRPGGPVAAAWATLHALGEDGYLALTRDTIEAKQKLMEGLAEIDDVDILGSENGPIVTWATREANVYAVADQLAARRWGVERQQDPPSIHCTVTANHLDVVEEYVADVAAAIAHVRAHPELTREGEAAMYGMMAKIPVRGAVRLAVLKVLEEMHQPGDGAVNLSDLDDEAPGILGLVGRYQGQALDALDALDDVRKRLRSRFGGG